MLKIPKLRIQEKCIDSAYEHLRGVGHNGLEGVVLWAGITSPDESTVTTTIIPRQRAQKSEEGLLYSVDGDTLHEVNIFLYRNQLTLLAQIHSHPGAAYHSSTDDEYSIITAIGGYSIVIPNFAYGPKTLDEWAVYRLIGQQKWSEISTDEVGELFVII